MSTLIPVHASQHILDGITEYLSTTFSLANPETSAALKKFLGDPDQGMFHGPYVRTRLPYARATGWENLLAWLPSWFRPYHHQAEAFRRLRSIDEVGERRPDPTLVITGTGSGKTESFLYPILNHAARTRRQGKTGVKALLLYPMNALANDQASRLASLLTEEKALQGVTAGIFTGEQSGSSGATKVSADSLITSRERMVEDPPDILLTNYKMLDQLLLRPDFRRIWEKSATSLQYVALDEFHTYDGAQGTDVALLLRRLGLQLKKHQPSGFLGEYADNPLGRVTPVATSATLGGEEQTSRVLDFAHTIFGERFPDDALVGEKILSYDEWLTEIVDKFGQHTPGQMPDIDHIQQILRRIADDTDDDTGREHPEVVLEVLREELWGAGDSLEEIIAAYAQHPLTRALIEAAGQARPLIQRETEEDTVLPFAVLHEIVVRSIGVDAATEFVTHLLTGISHIRALAGEKYGFEGKRLPGVETHLWVREVSRIDRTVTPSEDGEIFRWSDDGQVDNDDGSTVWLPACFCRACGRAGWMTSLEPGTDGTILDSAEIRRGSIDAPERQRPLIDATNEYQQVLGTANGMSEYSDADGKRNLLWLHTETRELSRAQPSEHAIAEGLSVPVLAYSGTNAEDYAREQLCPSCGEADSIRFIGSRVATLLSVGLSNLFGMGGLDGEEKKTLVFADSVQDAAHRAGFVQSRSRACGLRTVLFNEVRGQAVVGRSAVSLADLPRLVIDSADAAVDPARARYELLPPELADTDPYRPFWHGGIDKNSKNKRKAARTTVEKRLGLDIVLEFGQRADLPRSLTLTGALAVGVDIADEILVDAASQALSRVAEATFQMDNPDQQRKWARGVVELIRERGGINQVLLQQYLRDDANPWQLHRAHAKHQGIPSFPKGGSPEFPREGKEPDNRDRGISPLGGPRGRYARWTAAQLGLSPHDAATAALGLAKALAERGVLTAIKTNSHGVIYALEPERVVVEIDTQPHVLRCEICNVQMGLRRQALQDLDRQRCFTPGCGGSFYAEAVEPNYYSRLYTSSSPRAVVAKEHTGLVPKDERLALERSFRGEDGATSPDAPNVLVATPTLEMGIDIGDLSTVMLASLPKTVASYVQRVGRAGRLTGNSLVLAFVRGRGQTLPKLNQPLSVISGVVAPPAAFLSATEILHRQVTAYIIDSLDSAEMPMDLRNAASVFSSRKQASLVKVLQAVIAGGGDGSGADSGPTGSGVATLVDEYLATLVDQGLGEDLLDEVRAWATGQGEQTLTGDLGRAQKRWEAEVKTLQDRQQVLIEHEKDIERRIGNADAREDLDAELAREKRSTKAALHRVRRDLHELALDEYWISSMERYGLLPNFTLLDDSVELAVAVSYLRPATVEFDTDTFEVTRGVSSALHELAPGATFYARGIAARIDSVEMGAGGGEMEQWRVCSRCSYGERVVPGSTAGSCPSCGVADFADKGQVLDSIPLRKVSAEVDYGRASISDRDDERLRMQFRQAMTFSAPKDAPTGGSWFTSSGFGAEHLPLVDITCFNLGKGHGTRRMIAGEELETPLFTLCRHCGHIDSARGENSKWDHRPWCPQRKEREEDTVTTALARTLRTQGVLLRVPKALTAGDRSTVPSLTAAIMLGFKEVLGGDPDHLSVDTVEVADHTGATGTALLLSDSVPGGTGYLSQFASAQQVRGLLESALCSVRDCECAKDDRLACPECLLAYAPSHQVDVVDRAAAERALRVILLDNAYPSADDDPLAHEWETQEHAPNFDQRSHLELRFLEMMRDSLEDRNVEVTDRPRGGGREWDIKFPDGQEWVMREQVNLGYTVPDFVFTHRKRPDIRPVAVFTDGYQFHASPQNFGFGKDIRLRVRLEADKNWIPWTITDKDFDRFADEAAGTARAPWWAGPRVQQVVGKVAAMDSTGWAFMTASPVEQLVRSFQHSDARFYPALHEAVANMALANATTAPEKIPSRRGSGQGMRTMFAGQIALDAEAVRTAGGAVTLVPVQLYLDISGRNLDQQLWNDYLSVANLLWLSGARVTIATSETDAELLDSVAQPEQLADSLGGTVAAATSSDPSADASTGLGGKADVVPAGGFWHDVFADYDEEDEDDGEIVAALRLLVDAGVIPGDTIGAELASLPTVVTWDAQKVALLEAADESYAEAEKSLQDDGWRLLYAEDLDTDDIPDELLQEGTA